MGKKIIPLVRPTLAPWPEVEPLIAQVWESGQLTCGAHTARFENAVREVAGAKNAVALSSCTSGLMLLVRALELSGEVILPSFTWASTGHALIWNRLAPVFADCEPGTCTLDPRDVKRKITSRTSAIFAANVFGLHPDIDALQQVADEAGVPLLCDSAQAIGAKYKGRAAGSTALAEVFSFSPTKVVTAFEGGIVTTGDDALAEKVRRMRDYGKSRDGKDVDLFGLSARMSEIHSIVAAANLARLRELTASRAAIAALYRELLSGIGDLSFQQIPQGYESSYNYFVVFTGRARELMAALAEQGIQTKRYFHPPLHKLASYVMLALPESPLPRTERASETALALPFYSHMDHDDVRTVAGAIVDFYSRL